MAVEPVKFLLPVEPSAAADAEPSPDRLVDRHQGRRVRKRNAYMSTASATGRPRFVTREIAALEFLGSIAMCAEPRIVARHRALVDDGAGFGHAPADDGDGAEGVAALAMPEHDAAPGEAGDRAGGRRLPGREAAVVRVPRAFRHSLLRVPPGAAVVRQWERRAHGHGAPPQHSGDAPGTSRLLDSRVFFSASRGYPTGCLSIIRYRPREEEARRRRRFGDEREAATVFDAPQRDWRGVSYAAAIAEPVASADFDVGERARGDADVARGDGSEPLSDMDDAEAASSQARDGDAVGDTADDGTLALPPSAHEVLARQAALDRVPPLAVAISQAAYLPGALDDPAMVRTGLLALSRARSVVRCVTARALTAGARQAPARDGRRCDARSRDELGVAVRHAARAEGRPERAVPRTLAGPAAEPHALQDPRGQARGAARRGRRRHRGRHGRARVRLLRAPLPRPPRLQAQPQARLRGVPHARVRHRARRARAPF